jgi:hypothetical protein
MNIDWNKVQEALRTGVVEVTFQKANKELRVMQATLAEYLLPPVINEVTRDIDDLVVVFDIEKEAWRSFKKSSVIDVHYHE